MKKFNILNRDILEANLKRIREYRKRATIVFKEEGSWIINPTHRQRIGTSTSIIFFDESDIKEFLDYIESEEYLPIPF